VASDQILFFSSDATQLYQADIFRCLAAPDCFTIQFRYTKMRVQPEIWRDSKKIQGRPGIVIFVAGNDQKLQVEERKLQFYPIRFCTVKDAFFDPDTEQMIVILALGLFIDCKFDANEGPPKYWLTLGREADHSALSWVASVRRLQSHFPNVVFFRLKAVLAKSEVVHPRYLEDYRISCFDLEEEGDYSIECLYYDPAGKGLLPISIKSDSDRIQFSNTFAFGAGADLDRRPLHVKTGLLTSRSARAFTTFSCSSNDCSDDPNYLQVLWRINRYKWKDWGFALCVLPAAVGLGLVQLGSKADHGWYWISLALLGALFVAASGGLLYRYFNKT
jgi:hypothetical protein